MTVYILVMTVTFLGHSGDVLPVESKFRFVGDNDKCKAARVRLERHLKRNPPIITPDRVRCIAFEVKK